MRDLSKLLWCDLNDNEERVEFLRSGLAHKTGIIASSMVDDIADTYELLDAVLSDLQHAQTKLDELATIRAKAEAYDKGKNLWMSFDADTNEPYAVDRDVAVVTHDTWKLLGRHPQGNMPGGFIKKRVRVCEISGSR